ncbi:MAG TPA: hypothetical protein VGB54_05410 [Allosphingosinicella sp.]|jgi:hypothetical protein
MARDNLTRARISDGSYVSAETPAERAGPIVPRPLEEQTIARALLNAHFEGCGVDYTRISYGPYMGRLRASGRYGDKQMAYLGLLHGFTLGIAGQSIDRGQLDCNEATLGELARRAATMTIETP